MLAASLVLAASPATSVSVEFSARVTRTHPADASRSNNGMMYVGSRAIRTESHVQNQALRVIFHTETNEVWILFPDRKAYLKQQGSRSSRPPLPDEAASPCQTDKNFSCRRVGNERINNRDTQHWHITYNNPQGAQESTHLWIDPRLQIAIKEQYHDGGLVQLTDIREETQNSELFKIPGDYQQIILPNVTSPTPGTNP
ncbi:MAG: DUF4412 domain-containing protein [Magnetococcales bacterium]|nr:DUF4412 domain-containing protein [Magnetococcales bacterium]